MATNPPKPTVSITAGENEQVNNVINFEDLVQQLKQGAPAKARSGPKAAHREQLIAIQQLATDLEQRLREMRDAQPAQPTPAPLATRRKPKG